MVTAEQLRQLYARAARKAQLDRQLEELEASRFQLSCRVQELDRIRIKEQTDVDRLETRSLSSLFAQLMGNLEEKLNRERQEAYAAQAQYDAAVRELEDIGQTMGRMQAESAGLAGCQEEYHRLLSQRQEELKASGGDAGRQILRLEEEMSWSINQLRELQEAVAAGQAAGSTAAQLLGQLDDASGWATFDVFSDSMFSDLAKYSSLDAAQNLAGQLQFQLRSFRTELADVAVDGPGDVGVDGFTRFADYFFDNIFSDFAVMQHIERSRSQVRATCDQIDAVLDRLCGLEAETRQTVAQLREQLDRLVRSAGDVSSGLPQ